MRAAVLVDRRLGAGHACSAPLAGVVAVALTFEAVDRRVLRQPFLVGGSLAGGVPWDPFLVRSLHSFALGDLRNPLLVQVFFAHGLNVPRTAPRTRRVDVLHQFVGRRSSSDIVEPGHRSWSSHYDAKGMSGRITIERSHS
jgi:hypothetical protein